MIPTIIPRRPFEDKEPNGYLESDNDFIKNNLDACVWFLENHEKLVFQKYENHHQTPTQEAAHSFRARDKNDSRR